MNTETCFFGSILIGHKSHPIVPVNTQSHCSNVTENMIWIICIWFGELYLSKWRSGARNHLWIQILKTCTYTCSEADGNAVLLSPDISLSSGVRKKRGADTTRWVPSAVDHFQIKQSCGRCRIKPRIQSRCFYLKPDFLNSLPFWEQCACFFIYLLLFFFSSSHFTNNFIFREKKAINKNKNK